MKIQLRISLFLIIFTTTLSKCICINKVAFAQGNFVSINVDGKANIYGAGHSSPPAPGGRGGGILPPSYTLPQSNAPQVLTFESVSGNVSCCGPTATTTGPKGYVYPTNLSSYGGISGIRSSRAQFLAGVFLSNAEPSDPAPSIIDFSGDENYLTLSPQIGQGFYIGDGTAGDGETRVIRVPQGATRLYLGIYDGANSSGLPGSYSDNYGSFNALLTVNNVLITKPFEIAQPRYSAGYVALEGIGQPGANIDFAALDENLNPVGRIDAIVVRDDGTWEKLLYVSNKAHFVRAAYTASRDLQDIIQLNMPTSTPSSPALSGVGYELLEKADVILAYGDKAQTLLYGANYSHAALYIGGDADGTPLIAEAVPSDEAGQLGEVRAAPLELSTVYTADSVVDFYRPTTSLNTLQKQKVADAAKNYCTQGLPYWKFSISSLNAGDFKWFLLAALEWDSQDHMPIYQPIFDQFMKKLDDLKNSNKKFICSTLVSRSYLDGAGLDLSRPNNAGSYGILQALAGGDPSFLYAIRPHFCFPDTIAQCGLLTHIN